MIIKYDLFHRAGGDYIYWASAIDETIEELLEEWYSVHPKEKLLIQVYPKLKFGEGEYGEGRFANDNGRGGMA